MRQKISYLLAAALLAAALPLFASGEEEAPAPAAAGTSEPQYGGTITVLNFLTDALGVPDPHYGSGSTAIKNMVGERIQVGDIHQFGIRGNGAFAFTDDAGLPLPYKMGGVAESWEVTSDKLILKVRDGIMWSGKTINDVMGAARGDRRGHRLHLPPLVRRSDRARRLHPRPRLDQEAGGGSRLRPGRGHGGVRDQLLQRQLGRHPAGRRRASCTLRRATRPASRTSSPGRTWWAPARSW